MESDASSPNGSSSDADEPVFVNAEAAVLQLCQAAGGCPFRLGAGLDEVLAEVRSGRWPWLGKGTFTYSETIPLETQTILDFASCGVSLVFGGRVLRLVYFDVRPRHKGKVRLVYRAATLHSPVGGAGGDQRHIAFTAVRAALHNSRLETNGTTLALVAGDNTTVFFALPPRLENLPLQQLEREIERGDEADLVPVQFRVMQAPSSTSSASAVAASIDVTSLDGSTDPVDDFLLPNLSSGGGAFERPSIYAMDTVPPSSVVHVWSTPFYNVPLVDFGGIALLNGGGAQRVGGGRSNNNSTVAIGDSCERVVEVLGAPSQMYTPRRSKTAHVTTADYYYNYFHLGVDVLMSGQTHLVTSIVLHTNMPGQVDFTQYRRCHFALHLPSNDVWQQLSGRIPVRRNSSSGGSGGIDSSAGGDSADLLGVPDILPPPQLSPSARLEVAVGDAVTIDSSLHTGSMAWSDLCSVLGRVDEVDAEDVAVRIVESVENPFGPTRLYNHGCVIFEVMGNNHLATVTVFSPDHDRHSL